MRRERFGAIEQPRNRSDSGRVRDQGVDRFGQHKRVLRSVCEQDRAKCIRDSNQAASVREKTAPSWRSRVRNDYGFVRWTYSERAKPQGDGSVSRALSLEKNGGWRSAA